MAFAIGNVASNNTWAGSGSGTVTISLSAGSVLLVCAHQVHATVTETVASVTSANLTFAKRTGASHSRINSAGNDTWHQEMEVWWAYVPSALTNEVITVTSSGTPTNATIAAVECQGVEDPSSPWDTNASLPASADGGATVPTVTGITTDASKPVGFMFEGTTEPAGGPDTGWTSMGASPSNGGATLSEIRDVYQAFSSAQSGASWTWTAGVGDWMVVADAFSMVPVVASAALALSEAAPTAYISIVAPEADLALAAIAPGLNLQVSVGAQALALSASTPVVSSSTLTVPSAGISLAENAPGLGLQVTVGPASASLSAQSPEVILSIAAPAAHLVLSGNAPAILLRFDAVPGSASLVLTPEIPFVDVHTQTAGPFYFALVDAEDNFFVPNFVRNDLDVLAFSVEHDESDVAKASVDIKNPRHGLLQPGAKLWAWLSYRDWRTDLVTPLFFGRLVGIPDDMENEVITLQYVAKPIDYAFRLQAAAEALRARPGYDPVFADISKQDDPNTILEGYSRLWHVDRVTHAVTSSDVLVGEDGTEVFQQEEVPYDSVKQRKQQSPLSIVKMDATVNWTQYSKGGIDLGQQTVRTYIGEQLISAWPKPYTSLGDGWSTRYCYALDKLGTAFAELLTINTAFQNTEATHQEGDIMSSQSSWTVPSFDGSISKDFLSYKLLEERTAAVIDGSDPDFVDIPTATDKITTFYVLPWLVETYMSVEYEASRPRTERIRFTLQSDIQPVLTQEQSPLGPPGETPDFETISLQGADVGELLPTVVHWQTIANTVVTVGIIVLRENENSYQVCIAEGLTGEVEPAFSDVAGVVVSDNLATWASMGPTLPLPVPTIGYSTFYPAGSLIYSPPIIDGPYQSDASFLLVLAGGASTGTGLDSLGRGPIILLPNGQPVPGPVVPALATLTGDFLNLGDGSGGTSTTGPFASTVYIPIGNVASGEYFPTDRGLRSVEHLIARAAARLRIRARVVEIEFDCPFERAIQLSCRKNAVLYDPRLPGGVAAGKIISYSFSASGDTQLLIGHVKIGCSVGLGNSIGAIEGTPEYCDTDYVDIGYQMYDGAENLLDTGDVAYTPPRGGQGVDDGLRFPLTKADVIANNVIGNADAQVVAIAEKVAFMQANIGIFGVNISGEPGFLTPFGALNPQTLLARQIWLNKQIQQLGFQQDAERAAQYVLSLPGINGGPFGQVFEIATSNLSIPMTIDLQAPSSP